MAQRRRPPPDVDMIKDGFVLTEREASENMVQRKIVNRKSKKVVVLPQTLTEKDYVARLKKEARNMLMGVSSIILEMPYYLTGRNPKVQILFKQISK